MAKSLRQNPGKCHLCKLPIPTNIVSPTHPLYGTIDHVRPLSRGGWDTKRNRAPAHHLCNRVKGNDWPITSVKRLNLVHAVAEQLRLVGIQIGKKKIHQIKCQILGNADYKYDAMPDLFRWDDDGGAPYVRPHWRGKMSSAEIRSTSERRLTE